MQTTASATSECIRPSLLEADRTCWDDLDLDSHEIGSFSEADVVGLPEVLRVTK